MRVHLLLILFSIQFLLNGGDQKPRNIDAGWIYDILPQIADGEYWKTTIILTNLEDHPVAWTLKFYGDDGKPKEFTLSGMGKASVFAGALAKDGSVTLSTPGGTGTLSQGWAEIASTSGDDIGAMVIFGTTGVPNRPDFEATVPAVYSIDDDVVIPFDNTNGYVTSLALLNPGTYSDSVFNIRILDNAGVELQTERLTLKAGNKVAFASTDRWQNSRGRSGTIAIKGDTLVWASSLALRFHPGGAFTTVFPMSR